MSVRSVSPNPEPRIAAQERNCFAAPLCRVIEIIQGIWNKIVGLIQGLCALLTCSRCSDNSIASLDETSPVSSDNDSDSDFDIDPDTLETQELPSYNTREEQHLLMSRFQLWMRSYNISPQDSHLTDRLRGMMDTYNAEVEGFAPLTLRILTTYPDDFALFHKTVLGTKSGALEPLLSDAIYFGRVGNLLTAVYNA